MTAQGIVEAASAAGLTITTAESCTGGMVAAALTDIPGSSAVFERGFITYSNAAKAELLGVPQATLDAHGAVSEETARDMAEGARRAARADIAVAITGIAGPGLSGAKPEGRVCFALARSGQATRTETRDFGAQGRAEVRRLSRDRALALIAEALC